ncbi:MAG: flagellar basal body-associated FliL family protein [Flavobacteriaceae bacterium]
MADAAIAEDPDLTEADEASEGAGEGASKRKKLIMLGGAAVLAVAVIGGGAGYLAGWFSPAAETAEAPVVESYYFDLPDLVVNLSALDDRAQYLKLRVTLETHDKRSLSALEPAMPKVLDAFQVYLRELRVTDIEGSAGLQRLKEELLRRINIAIHPAKVDAVLFREIIVQ